MKLSEKIKFIRKNILNLSIEEFASILVNITDGQAHPIR